MVTRCHNLYCHKELPGRYLGVQGEVFCSRKCQQEAGRPGIVVGEEPSESKKETAGESMPSAHKGA